MLFVEWSMLHGRAQNIVALLIRVSEAGGRTLIGVIQSESPRRAARVACATFTHWDREDRACLLSWRKRTCWSWLVEMIVADRRDLWSQRQCQPWPYQQVATWRS